MNEALKLQGAKDLLHRVAALSGGAALVALSGGKDSQVVLDLAVAIFPRIECYFMYLVEGLEVEERPVRAAIERYQDRGVRLHKIPHYALSSFYNNGVLGPRRPMRELRQRDVEAYIRQKTGLDWIIDGQRVSDSLTRCIQLRAIQGIDVPFHRVHPIWQWKTPDVYTYLKVRGIPAPMRFGDQRERGMSGFSLEVECLAWLKANHPDDFRKVLNVFPFADAQLKRQEFAPTNVAPKVRGRRARPVADQERAVQPKKNRPPRAKEA